MNLDAYRYQRMQLRKTMRNQLVQQLRPVNPDLAASVQNLNVPWFSIEKSIRNQTTEDTTEVYIYQEIDWFWGLSADTFVEELNQISTKNIDLRLNSPGGDVFDSIAIYNALVKHPANVTVYVDSLAASGASVIAMSGDDIVMMVGSQMMIHDAMGLEIGNAAQLREYATFLDAQSDNIASIYASRAGGEVKDWRTKMLAETWVFADEAVEIGLADRVYSKETDAPEETQDPDQADEPDPATPEEPAEPGEDQPPMPMPEEDNELDDLMKGFQHSLANHGWKYAGRNKSPEPIQSGISNSILDNFISSIKRK